MTQFSDDPGTELRQLFFESARELLQALNEEALKLEKKPSDMEAGHAIRRTVHTLKGDSAACGFRELSELAHELEDALGDDEVLSQGSLAEIAFTAADTFDAMLAAYSIGGKLPSVEAVRKIVRGIAGAKTPAKTGKKNRAKKTPGVPDVAWTEYETVAMQTASGQGKSVFQITAQIDPLCVMPMAARQLVTMALNKVGEVIGTRPEAGSEGTNRPLHLLVASLQDAESLAARCRIPTVTSEVHIKGVGTAASASNIPSEVEVSLDSPTEALIQSPASVEGPPPESLAEPESNAAHKFHPAAESTLRVDSGKIDAVLNLVGELIIGKSMLQQALNELAVLHPKEAIRGRFADAMAFQSRVLGDLQRSVMKVRMVPVEQLFRRFPRMVRDVAKRCGKDVELVIRGEHTDLDKSLLDAIAEPLTHMVRNAISHGIESSAERVKSGKPAAGTIRLEAYHQANHVIVCVKDDGQGIDLTKVKAKAVSQGMISPAEASTLNCADATDLLFKPGFTTAEEVTEISGRGVGLDVVRSVLQRLKGTVDIETRVGEGTTFILKLPLTLAIIKALLFRVERRIYAIPLNAVAEITRAYESDLHQVESYEVLQLRNQVLPIIRLGRSGLSRGNGRQGKIFVLVIAFNDRKLGLIVDSMEGEEELVIKALDDHTVTTDLVSGASILGDGRVVLIMNLAAIVERFSKSRSEENAAKASSGLLLSHAERIHFEQLATGVQQ